MVIEIDEPFEIEIDFEDLPNSSKPTPPAPPSVPVAVVTPTGLEIVFNDECDETTLVMSRSRLDELIEQSKYDPPQCYCSHLPPPPPSSRPRH